jgi:TRAP transporter TAXI family solute receptor
MPKPIQRALCALALTTFTVLPAHAQGPLGIGTLPQGSLGYAIAAAVAKVVSEHTDLQLRAVGQGGSSVYIPRVNADQMAFGTSNTFEAVFATRGTGNFAGKPNPNLRVAAMLVPFQVGFMVAKDSDIQAITDLKGKPFPVGYARMKLVGIMQDAIFQAVGMSPQDLQGVPVPNFVKGAELLAQGKVAGVLLAPGSGVVKKTYAQTPVRFLSIPHTTGVESKIQKALPGAHLVLVEPNPRTPSIATPVYLLGYQYALLTNAAVPDEVVYKVVKAIHDGKGDLAAAHGIFHRFDPAKMAPPLPGAQYHAGAIRFYKEAGMWSQ